MDNFFTFLEIYWYVAAQKPHIQSIAVKSQKPRIQTGRHIKAPPSQKPRIQTYIPQKMENYRKKYSKKPRIQTISARSKNHVFKLGGTLKLHHHKNHVSKPIYRKKWKIIGRNTVKNHVSKLYQRDLKTTYSNWAVH